MAWQLAMQLALLQPLRAAQALTQVGSGAWVAGMGALTVVVPAGGAVVAGQDARQFSTQKDARHWLRAMQSLRQSAETTEASARVRRDAMVIFILI